MKRFAWVALLALAACSKSSGDVAPAAAGSAPAAASASSAAAAPSSSAAAASSGGAAASSSWAGSYKSAAASISVPPEWKKVHWSDTKSTEGIGDGAMALAIDGATGHVTGTLEGPLGPATLDGASADGTVSATLVRKDPGDHGFGGTLLATVTGDKLEGTMNLSLGTGGVVRTATFSLARGGAR
ncbi:MAG TPA: hypothetical protein VGG39_30020 [Polyangiaceae bacterium]|jgi:hypothetical protein